MFKDWILGLITAAVLAALAQQFSFGGAVEKVTGFACSLMLMGALLSPVVKLDLNEMALSFVSYRETVAELTENLETEKTQMVRSYIEEQCAAYILDEAHVLGVDGGSVEVKAEWSNDSWIPYEAVLTMSLAPEEKRQLSNWMVAQMGIAEERQRWNESGINH